MDPIPARPPQGVLPASHPGAGCCPPVSQVAYSSKEGSWQPTWSQPGSCFIFFPPWLWVEPLFSSWGRVHHGGYDIRGRKQAFLSRQTLCVQTRPYKMTTHFEKLNTYPKCTNLLAKLFRNTSRKIYICHIYKYHKNMACITTSWQPRIFKGVPLQ